jgi:hypothetical protein
MNNVERDIAQARERLLKQFNTKGLCENFGKNEVDKLYTKYSDYQYSYIYKGLWNMIVLFDKWCQTFDGKVIR